MKDEKHAIEAIHKLANAAQYLPDAIKKCK